jgi:hypothetical protein
MPNGVLEFWLKYFWTWLLKECIVTGANIENMTQLFPQIREIEKSKSFRKAKLMQ